MADNDTPSGEHRIVPLPHRTGGLSSALQRRDHRTVTAGQELEELTPLDKVRAERARRVSTRRPSGLSASFMQASRGEPQTPNFTSRPGALGAEASTDTPIAEQATPQVAPPEVVNIDQESSTDADPHRERKPGVEDASNVEQNHLPWDDEPAWQDDAAEPRGSDRDPHVNSASGLRSRMISPSATADQTPASAAPDVSSRAFTPGPTPQAEQASAAVRLRPHEAFDDSSVSTSAGLDSHGAHARSTAEDDSGYAPREWEDPAAEVDVLPTVYIRENIAPWPEDIVDAELETGEIPAVVPGNHRDTDQDAPFGTVAHSDQRAPITGSHETIAPAQTRGVTGDALPTIDPETQMRNTEKRGGVVARRLIPAGDLSEFLATTQTAEPVEPEVQPHLDQQPHAPAPTSPHHREAGTRGATPPSNNRDIAAPKRLRRHSAGEPILSLHGVKAKYGRKKALNGANVDVVTGDILAIIGPPHSGKTTLLNAMLGLIKVSGGKVLVDDVPVHGPVQDALRSAQIAGVTPGLLAFPNLTVRENLAVAAVDGIPPGRVADEVLGYFPHLAEHADRPASELTRVDHVILSLAKILITNPRLIIIDDIARGLSNTELDILEVLLRQIAATGTAIVLADRDPYAALQLSRNAVVVQEGHTVKKGKSAEIYDLLVDKHITAD